MADTISDSEKKGLVRYLSRILDNAHYSIRVSWKAAVECIALASGLEETEVTALLKDAGIGYSGQPGAAFTVLGVYDAQVTEEVKSHAFNRILSVVREDTFLRSVLLLISAGYNFTLALLEFLSRVERKLPAQFVDNPYLAIVTSDFFIESREVNEYVKSQISRLSVDVSRLKSLTREEWFLDLLTILKSGASVNESRGFLKLMEKQVDRSNVDFITGIVMDGTLPAMVINRNFVMKQDFVSGAFERKYEAEQHVKRLKTLYYWLGIANDFILGVLFLVGSLEFLPHKNEILGVYMFIVGSAQLVGRSVIKIVMNLHVRRHSRRKIAEADDRKSAREYA